MASLTFVDAAAAVGEPAYERAHGGLRQYSIDAPWRAASINSEDDFATTLQSAAQQGLRLRRIDSFNIAILSDDDLPPPLEQPPPPRRLQWLRPRPCRKHQAPPPGPHVIRLNRRMTREQQELLIDAQLKQPNDNEALLQKIRARLDRCGTSPVHKQCDATHRASGLASRCTPSRCALPASTSPPKSTWAAEASPR